MDTTWDTIVIGGGAAGLSAALMLGRARRRTLVIDSGSPRNRFAAHMHGVLGLDGVSPTELLRRGRAEVQAYGVEILGGAVERVEDAEDGLLDITLADGEVRRTRSVIVATGITDELPAVPGLAERWGVSVLHCPYCHGWEVRDRRIGVLVTSPLGLHQAELVRQWSDRVTVFTAGAGDLEPATAQRLKSRGVVLVAEPVVEILGDGPQLRAVRTADGVEVGLDAVFTAGIPRPHDGFLAPLDLTREEGPAGGLLTVDPTGRTSHPRVWAVGNVVEPFASVPIVSGRGSMTGAMVNMALVTEDFDAAVAQQAAAQQAATQEAVAQEDPASFWEGRYADSDRVWSGRPNQILADVVPGLAPGRALDLGCGEGADAIWLALGGWDATGIDISPTAVERAARAASAAGVPAESIRFVATDLEAWDAEEDDDEGYDLVTASFLQSPVALSRTQILRRAAARIAPGGHLLVVTHASAPSWAQLGDHEHHFPSPAQEVEDLGLDAGTWSTVLAETRTREATGPDGQRGVLDDSVVLLRRR